MIRLSKVDDLIQINRLGILATSNFQKTYDLKKYLQDSKYIILVNQEEIINGVLIIFKNVDFYELEVIAVDENYRYQGIASNLLSYFIDKFMLENDKIILEVAINNTNALKLYEKFNFKIINTRKKYYDGIDGYVMEMVK